MENNTEKRGKITFIPVSVKSFIFILLSSVLAYKIIITPFNLQFDFSSLLSLLLALFSVGLAALFYFKATETSNAFYNNTYKFSQDIAELLARIESGFGERLRHLDETYKGMADSFEKLPSRINIKDATQELKKEEEELQKIIDDREQLINELASKAQLRDEEKSKFIENLRSKEVALQEAQQEINFLKRRLRQAKLPRDRVAHNDNLDPRMTKFIHEAVLDELGPEFVVSNSHSSVKNRFDRIVSEFPKQFIDDLARYDFVDAENKINRKGVKLLKQLAYGKS